MIRAAVEVVMAAVEVMAAMPVTVVLPLLRQPPPAPAILAIPIALSFMRLGNLRRLRLAKATFFQ